MEEFVKLMEQAGFSVKNANDYQNIEIRDLRNNGELLKKDSYDFSTDIFRGSNDREIILSFGGMDPTRKFISINNGNGLIITQSFRSNNCEYGLQTTLNDGTKTKVEFRPNVSGFSRNIGGMKVVVSQQKNEEENSNREHFIIQHKLFETQIEKSIGNEEETDYKTVDVENCNIELYINAIMDFLNGVEFTANNSKIQEGFKILLPLISENLENIFVSYRENLEKFIQLLEESKIKAEEEENQLEVARINNDIERLRNLSQSKSKTK